MVSTVPRRAILGLAATAALVAAQAPAAVFAQDECAATTPEENMAIVEGYVAAVASGDAEAVQAALHPDFTHNLGSESVPVDVADIDLSVADSVGFEIIDMFGTDDRVAVEFTYDVHPDAIDGSTLEEPFTQSAVALVTIECGTIANAVLETDHLETLQSHGWEIDPSA